MDDKELVEVWQSEFEKLMHNANLSKHPEGDYVRDPIDAMWRGFLMAKRSQPAITVPAYDMHHSAPVRNLMAKMDSAGIKYTVGD